MSRYSKFLDDLSATLKDCLADGFEFHKSRGQLLRQTDYGHDVIILSGSGRYSPHVSVSFYFGINFAKAREIECAIGNKGDQLMYYHISQYSLNRSHMRWLFYFGRYDWSVDLNSPPSNLVRQLHRAVLGMAYPFFEKFGSLAVARDAMAQKRHGWCLGGPSSWRQVLVLDAALGDLDHFREWSKQLDDFSKKQAEVKLEKVAQAMAQLPQPAAPANRSPATGSR